MNAVLVQPKVEEGQTLVLVPRPVSLQEMERYDPHPLLAVFIAACIAATGAILFAGTLLSWVLLRYTGINAPW